jgi:hypothetical protein
MHNKKITHRLSSKKRSLDQKREKLVKHELDRVQRDHGGILYPKDVVEAARPKKSPLHDEFEWDNTVAAERWRMEQARHLIRVFVNVIEEGHSETRVYVALSSDRSGGGGYRATVNVLSNKGLREVMLSDALEDMRSFKAKYLAIKELAAVFAEMDKAEALIEKSVAGSGK